MATTKSLKADVLSVRPLLERMTFRMHLLSGDECRTLLFEFSVEWSALSVDHVISVHVTESPEDCELHCYLEDDCMSINIDIDIVD